MKATRLRCVLFAAVVAMGLTASAANGVKYFDSIEARAGQAIDTEISANGSLEVECEMEWLSVPADGSFVGARNSDERVYVIYSYDNWSMGYGDNIYGKVAIEPNKKYHVVSTVNSELRRCVVDGVEVVRAEGAKTINNKLNLYLFDACNNGSAGGGSSQVRLYWMKIRKANEKGEMELVRDFRPAKVNNRYGLYDAVSERLFAAIPSTGAFGPDSVTPRQVPAGVTYFDCLCIGNSAAGDKASAPVIDTEVIGRDGIQVEGELAWNADYNDNCFVGSRKDGNNTRFYVVYSYNAWSMANGVNIRGSVKYVPGQKYHVVSTITNGVSTCVVDGAEVLRDESGTIIDTGRNLYVLALNHGGYSDMDNVRGRVCPISGRIWWLKIRELDKATGEFKLLRDFRPACKDGEYGLYDEVSGRLFTALPTAPKFSRESMIVEATAPIPAPRPKTYLEFIELSGGAVMDTGVGARSGLETEVDFTPYADPQCANSYMLGTVAKNVFGFALMTSHGYRYGENNFVNPSNTQINRALTGTRKRIRAHLFAGEQWIEVNGVRTAQGSVAEAIDAGENLTLFGREALPIGATTLNPFCGRFYGCRIWEQDGADGLRLVRDFRPCLCDESIVALGGLPAVYDEVSGAYFPIRQPSTMSTRSPMPRIAAPVPGPRVMSGPQRRVEYLESDGAHCIFTGVQGKNDLKVEAKVAWLAYPGDAALLGTRGDGNTRCYLLYSNGGNKWIHCWNTWEESTATTVPIELGKICEVSSIYEDGLQQLIVDGTEVVNRKVTGEGGSTMDLSLFGLNRYFTEPTPFVKARVYTLKIWARDPEKGETEYRLVRDYEPCVNDGVPGLYDRVTGHLACEEKNLGCVGADGVVPGPTMKAGPYKPTGLKILFY